MTMHLRTYIGLLVVLLCGQMAVTSMERTGEERPVVESVCPSSIGDMGSIRERAALPTAALQDPTTGARLGHSRPARLLPTHGKNPRRQAIGFASPTSFATTALHHLGGHFTHGTERCAWLPIYARFYYVIAMERFLC